MINKDVGHYISVQTKEKNSFVTLLVRTVWSGIILYSNGCKQTIIVPPS